MRPAGLGLVLEPIQRGLRGGMGGLGRLECLLGDPHPVGHLVGVAVGGVGRLAGLLSGGGGHRGLVGEVPGDSRQPLGALVGLVGGLLAAAGQRMGLI
jgi:hypothetical protein